MKGFEMSDLRLLSFYLGIEVSKHVGGIILKQNVYVKKLIT